MAKKTAKKDKTPDFEGELEKLEEAVAKLEDGSLTLDEAITQFESGFKSWRHCQDLLEKARKKIEVLCEEAGIAGEDGASLSWEDAGSGEDGLDDE